MNMWWPTGPVKKDLEMMVSMWSFLLFLFQTGVFARPFLMEINPQTWELNSHLRPLSCPLTFNLIFKRFAFRCRSNYTLPFRSTYGIFIIISYFWKYFLCLLKYVEVTRFRPEKTQMWRIWRFAPLTASRLEWLWFKTWWWNVPTCSAHEPNPLFLTKLLGKWNNTEKHSCYADFFGSFFIIKKRYYKNKKRGAGWGISPRSSLDGIYSHRRYILTD